MTCTLTIPQCTSSHLQKWQLRDSTVVYYTYQGVVNEYIQREHLSWTCGRVFLEFNPDFIKTKYLKCLIFRLNWQWSNTWGCEFIRSCCKLLSAHSVAAKLLFFTYLTPLISCAGWVMDRSCFCSRLATAEGCFPCLPACARRDQPQLVIILIKNQYFLLWLCNKIWICPGRGGVRASCVRCFIALTGPVGVTHI